ncbi:hypothetical protein GCM10022262_25100 [Georgenia daeguensis]|uniref:Uncharacterized protein n=1 Tax=Georgenia daeguensis TaxID=908355 RepID=A0ABP8EVZ2_9MICO
MSGSFQSGAEGPRRRGVAAAVDEQTTTDNSARAGRYGCPTGMRRRERRPSPRGRRREPTRVAVATAGRGKDAGLTGGGPSERALVDTSW